MKKKTLGILITSIIVLSGCSNKATVNDVKKGKSSNEIKKVSTDIKSGDSASNIKDDAIDVNSLNSDVKLIKPGTVPQLSSKQKTQINSNVSSTIKNIEDALKSIETPNDVKVE